MEKMWQTVRALIGSRKTLLATMTGTGGYVAYTDGKRYHQMVECFKHGKILVPVDRPEYTPCYQKRQSIEEKLRYIMGPEFTNQYYLVKGEVGTGKSRTIVEQVTSMIHNEGSRGEGAPIYVLATQRQQFSNTLGDAVNFKYDEHVNFKFFLQYLMQINKFPAKDDHNKLNRVLNAIECAAYRYTHSHGRPMVLVIDGANTLTTHLPGSLQKLQEKAKLWADENICKVVFVSNEEETERILKKNNSAWSRAGDPVYVGDLTTEEALTHLLADGVLTGVKSPGHTMDVAHAEKVYNLVGGRIQHLNIFKRDYYRNIPFDETANGLKNKEREKFVAISRHPDNWKAVDVVRKAPNMCVYLSNILKATAVENVDNLLRSDILKLVTTDSGVKVKFESRLTENTVQEMYAKYNTKS